MRRRRYSLRVRPEDFQVTELLEVKPKRTGGYGLYRLVKEGLDTYAALKIVSRRTGVPFSSIGYAGLKDRYSRSVQHISIPRRLGEGLGFAEKSLSLEHVCNIAQPVRIGMHSGNRFTITVRNMSRETLERLRAGVERLKGLQVPNYFDSQRFGSLRATGEFFALHLLKGEHEKALKLILTGRYRKERSAVKALKRSIEESWGDWGRCLEIVSRGPRFENYPEILSHLHSHSEDYRGALRLVRAQVMKMGFSALQSYIWNEALKRRLVHALGREALFPARYQAGELLFPRLDEGAVERYRELLSQHGEASMPMPHHRLDRSSPYYELLERMAGAMGFTLREMRRLERFGASLVLGERAMFFEPVALEMKSAGVDRAFKNSRRFYATLSYTLPPGCYATILIKSIIG